MEQTHNITEDYRDFVIRKDIEQRRKDSTSILVIGLLMVGFSFVIIFSKLFLFGLLLLLIGGAMSYFGNKFMAKAKKDYRYHIYRNYDNR